jgi:hypothetical protein
MFFAHIFASALSSVAQCLELSFRKYFLIELFNEKEKMVDLSYEVVKCPEVIFFLNYYVFEHASCCGVTAFECFSDDLTVK